MYLHELPSDIEDIAIQRCIEAYPYRTTEKAKEIGNYSGIQGMFIFENTIEGNSIWFQVNVGVYEAFYEFHRDKLLINKNYEIY